MKTTIAIASLIALAGLSQGAVTLQFSTTSVYASNFANGAGSAIASDGSNRMVWGLVVDTGGNGFNGASLLTPYKGGFNLSSNNTGINLSTTTTGSDTVASDDVLFIAGSVMASSTSATPPDGSLTNMNRLLSFSNLTYGGSVVQGKAFAVVWFNAPALSGSAAADGLQYGIYSMSSLNTLPADPGTYDVSAPFAGPDALKTMDYALNTLVPEPSAAILGAIGALGLLRRRRI